MKAELSAKLFDELVQKLHLQVMEEEGTRRPFVLLRDSVSPVYHVVYRREAAPSELRVTSATVSLAQILKEYKRRGGK